MGDCADLMGRQTVAYVQVASIAVLLFDICITFDSEIRWTWGRKWGIVRIAFVISRYIPIASAAMCINYAVESTRGGIPDPGQYLAVNASILILGAAAAEVLLVARTHAFCGGENRILVAVSLFSTVMIAATLTIANVVASKSGHPACGVFKGQRNAGIIYGLQMIFELVLMSLTLYKRFKFYRLEKSPLVVTIYRDGVIYMMCIVLVSVVNCVSFLVLPLSYSRLFYGLQAVLHSVLASRILFNLRATNESQDFIIHGPVASGVVFAHPIQTPSCVDRLELPDITHL